MTIALVTAKYIHEMTCRPYRTTPTDPRLAHPFGTPDDMPPHTWRMSWDVMQSLYEASPPPFGPNPKSSEGAVRLLFGWPVEVDKTAAPGTLLLEDATQMASSGPSEPSDTASKDGIRA